MSDDRYGHFDADAFRAAQEEPTLTVGHLLYRGRLLSIEEWMGFAAEFERIKDGEATPEAYAGFARRYLRAVFPRRRYRFWAPDPVKHLLAMPWAVVLEAITRFFVLQVRATGGADPKTATTGIASLHATPPLASETPPE